MRRSIRRILVAVKELRGGSSSTLKKAATLAHALGARVELFHALSDPLVIDSFGLAFDSVSKVASGERARCQKRLEAMARPLREQGLNVGVHTEWDYPAHQAVVRRARSTGADLIVAERHAGRHLATWMLHYNDWELLRHSPVPVLLVKTRRGYGRVKVLAAVDPSHELAGTAGLDGAILRVAAKVSSAAKGELHAVHAYVPSLVDIPPSELTELDAPARIVGHAAAKAQARLTKALRAAGLGRLPGSRRHVVARHAVDAIAQLAKAQRFDIVVMGLAHSGFKGLLIGNTSARLLDELACDLLVVKPAGFTTSVPAKPRGAHMVALGA